MTTAVPLSGAEQVLIAQVPRAGDRWGQVHFNKEVTARFFRVTEGEQKLVRLEKVDRQADIVAEFDRPLVISPVNRNSKIEFDFKPVRDYPVAGRPLLLVLEVGVRHFRYHLLLPGQRGYDEMLALNESLPIMGAGVPRVISYLDELELRWPSCPLRGRAAE